jgi:hypothetical protein
VPDRLPARHRSFLVAGDGRPISPQRTSGGQFQDKKEFLSSRQGLVDDMVVFESVLHVPIAKPLWNPEVESRRRYSMRRVDSTARRGDSSFRHFYSSSRWADRDPSRSRQRDWKSGAFLEPSPIFADALIQAAVIVG